MTYSEVKKILSSADQNKDGKLDYIEVVKRWKLKSIISI